MLKIWPNSPPWPLKHILQASSNYHTPRHTARPSIMAMPSFARHVTAQESVIIMLQPKNHSWHVTPRESVFALRSFSSNSDRRDILPDHPRRQSHLLPITSWPEIPSSSHYGPKICRECITALIRSSSHYSPKICLFLRLNK